MKRIFHLTGMLVLFAGSVFAQRDVTLLDKQWRFTRSDGEGFAARGYNDSGWEIVRVPHDWAIAGPFDMKIDAQKVTVLEDGEKVPSLRTGRSGALPWVGTGWYRKVLGKDMTARGRRHTLEFDGAMSNAQVYVNGRLVGGWPYGYSSFGIDITDFLDYGRDNVIAVRLENKDRSSRWYPGAGIYRNVRLVSTAPVHIPMWGTYVTTPQVTPQRATVDVRTVVENRSDSPQAVKLVTEITLPGSRVVSRAVSSETVSGRHDFAQELKVDNPRLWDLSDPHLYQVVSTVYVGDQLVDRYTTPLGIRTIRFDADKGFLLNGRLVEIQGVCQHHDLGPLGAAVNRRALERQIEILQEMGCNAIRMSHNPPAPELLDLCDRMGMLVMDESFDEWKTGKNANGYNTLFDQWAEKDMIAMIHRDRNHPSIILWSIGNEIREQNEKDGAKVARFLTDICHREDPTRPVTAGLNNWDNAIKNGFTDAVDVFGFNYKPFAYAGVHKDYPKLPLLGAETASTVSSRGVYHFPAKEIKIEDGTRPLQPDYQCTSYDLIYPRWASTPDTEFEAQSDLPYVAGEFVWTGFDYLGEPTPYNNNTPARSSYFGIVDLVGMKKDRFYLYQSRWSDTPVLHLLPHWNWEGHEGKPISVHCYTNYDRVELFLNGKSLGVKKKDLAQKYQRFRLVWDSVAYRPGLLMAVAFDKEGKKVAQTVVRTAGAPAAVVLSADRSRITADGNDLSYVTVTVVDAAGNPCPSAAVRLNFGVTGEGELEAVCNGDPTSHESFKGTSMLTFSGKCMAVVRSTEKPGGMRLSVKAEGLPARSIDITTVK